MKINPVFFRNFYVTIELVELKGFQWGMQELPIDFEYFVTSVNSWTFGFPVKNSPRHIISVQRWELTLRSLVLFVFLRLFV